MRIELQSAWVLHTRPYRDTSLIVDLLTRDHGRVSVIAKGVRKSGRSQKNNQRQKLNPFIPLLVSCQGRSELKTLTGIETHGHGELLGGKVLFSALYLNELLIRLLPPMDAHPQVFDHYQQVLRELGQCSQHADVDEQYLLECILRRFEFNFLHELGYGIDFQHDCTSGKKILAEHSYSFYPDRGFVLSREPAIPGVHLLALADDTFNSAEVRRTAKYLSRAALKVLLGGKPLKSREFFQQV